uniref:Sema domain-containing protein n=2 Tax=Callorhinchus milii TaxID=7868 RepID=A0A4W3IQ74_CALMI
MNYSIFLVDSSRQRLYVGAKNAIFSLSLTSVTRNFLKIEWIVSNDKHMSCTSKGKREIDCQNYIRILEFWNSTHLFVCGTYAFDPQCTYIRLLDFAMGSVHREFQMESGRWKCPFEPGQSVTATLADGVLYAATVNNFLGTESIISRTMGPTEKRVRTVPSVEWLNDPTFVASAFIRESESSNDDDKLYFFFTETARDFDFYLPVRVPRVARVCKGDLGGLKTLQKKWTTFLKAHLYCSHGDKMVFDEVQDVYTLQATTGDDTSITFYGVFSARWDDRSVSAVCAYTTQSIHRVLQGKFKDYNRASCKWTAFSGKIPEPRPGSCISKELSKNGFSSMNLSDAVLTFIRDHPLMEQKVKPIGNRALLVMRDTLYSKIVVRRVNTTNGRSTDVFYLGTGSGHLHKAVSDGAQAHVIEDNVVFSDGQKVLSIALEKDFVYVGASSGVVQLPAATCGRYSSCQACVLARDPTCGWNEGQGECMESGKRPTEGEFLQYDPAQKILCLQSKDSPQTKVLHMVNGSTVFLPCVPVSAWSLCQWTTPPGSLSNELKGHGLQVTVTKDSLGEYKCRCVEGEVEVHSISYSLELPASHDSRMSHTGLTYLLMFVVLCAGFILSLLFCYFKNKIGLRFRSRRQAEREKPCQASSDEIRPLAVGVRNGPGMNGTGEKEGAFSHMGTEANGMPTRGTISIISCQDETSI